MALLAEEIVEEWLNRQGYFTIRGIKLGVQEIDLLAIKFKEDGIPDCRHIEVQASMRPVSYISKVPKQLQKNGRPANSAKRDQAELEVGVAEWVEKKFRRMDKKELMTKLCKANWTSELVVNELKDNDTREVELIASHGIRIHYLREIVAALTKDKHKFPIRSASGADIIDLLIMGGHRPTS